MLLSLLARLSDDARRSLLYCTTTFSIVALLAFGMAAIPSTQASAKDHDGALGVLCGDSNGDETLSVSDALEIVRFSAGIGEECVPPACDTNSSGAVTVTDGLIVISHAVGLDVDMDCPDKQRVGDNVVSTIDFEGLTPGQVIDSVTPVTGDVTIAVFGSNPNAAIDPNRNAALTFDSSCKDGCSGGDDDLGTPNEDFDGPGMGNGGSEVGAFPNVRPLGNIAIIAENLKDGDGDGLIDDPDDQGAGPVTVDFDFGQDAGARGLGPVASTITLLGITYIDVEHTEMNPLLELFADDGDLISVYSLPTTGNNGVNEFVISDPIPGVTRFRLSARGSIGIDDIVFMQDVPPSSSTTTTTMMATSTTLPPTTTTTMPPTTTTVPPMGECGDGNVDPGEDCDPGTPGSGECCTAGCTFEGAGTACGDSGNECTDADSCDGAGACIPGDFKPAETPCSSPEDTDCSNPDSCNGMGQCFARNEPDDTPCMTDPCGDAATCQGGDCICPVTTTLAPPTTTSTTTTMAPTTTTTMAPTTTTTLPAGTQVIQDPAGNATGILGLELNGDDPAAIGVFDVEFVYGRGNDLFGGPLSLDFNDQADALVGAEAVAAVLAAESTAVTTVGPVQSDFFDIPYVLVGSNARVVRGNSDGAGGWTTGNLGESVEWFFEDRPYAKFTRVMTATTTTTLPPTTTTTMAPTTTTTMASTTTTTLPPSSACEEQLCAVDETLAQQCATFFEVCLAQAGEGSEDECAGGALFICEGGACGQDLCAVNDDLAQECRTFLDECLMAASTDVEVEYCVGAAIIKCAQDPLPEECQADLCAADETLAQQCTTFLETCLAQGGEEDEDECAAGALFICEGGACGREACAVDDDLAQACRTFLDDCLMGADSGVEVEYCVGAALFKCEPEGCQSDLECDNGVFCDGEEKCERGTGECDEGVGEPCGPREICNEDRDICIEEP